MTNLDVSNSSTDSSSGSSSDSSSSGSSSTSSGSGSSSSDSESSTSDNPVTTVPPASKSPSKQDNVDETPANNNNISNNNNKKKEEKARRLSAKPKPSSSSDGEPQIKIVENNKAPPTRRRSSAKNKSATAVTPKQSKPAPKSTTGAKTAKPAPKIAQKPPPKAETRSTLKKKSIFSPDNSSESEVEEAKNKVPVKPPPKVAPILRSKGRTRKSSNDKVKLPSPEKKEVKEVKELKGIKEIKEEKEVKEEKIEMNHKETNHVKRRSGSRTNGPPPKKTPSSCTSSQSSSDMDSHDSDSECVPKKGTTLKTAKTKTTGALSKSGAKPTETAAKGFEAELMGGAVPRKLTRSLSARVSRLAAAAKTAHTDTDSEADDKHNDKNATIMRKCGKKVLRSPMIPLTPPEPPEPMERRCPLRGCDSQGHLGGESEKHFTWDACPLYHNVTAAWCVAASEERASATVARRKAVVAMQQRPRLQPTIEQRAYQLKVKDMRSKWKSETQNKPAIAEEMPEQAADEREPPLEGVAPDYDLGLFREAQALAAIKIEEELQDLPAERGTRYVVMGKYMMEVWYQSPYPGDAGRVPRLFVCEFCLSHQKTRIGSVRHTAKCLWRHPPGDEVYRKNNLSVWQVDGKKHKQYCQQLCLLAKFFLDHKTLYYDVEPFWFYVMTLADSEGCHVVGYFSKEKNSFLNYNVSCILTLPPYQRQGFGRLLIDFSYLLTKVEGKVGSPETPLSDLGLISYRSYWKEALLRRLCSAPGSSLCVRDLSKDLAIASCDIVSTLQERGLMKYWKGKHIVLKKEEVLEEMSRRNERVRSVEPACLRWTPPASAPPR